MTEAQFELLLAIAEGRAVFYPAGGEAIGTRRGVILVTGSARIRMARRMVKLGWLTERRPCFTGGVYFEITPRGRRTFRWMKRNDY